MTPDERLIRANRAQQILDDPLIAEAFDGLERGAVERLAACDTNDAKKLQTLTLALQTVRSVRHRFEMWISEGKDEAQRRMAREDAPTLISRFRRSA